MNNKICFAGLLSELNLGDMVILKSTSGLYKEAYSHRQAPNFSMLNLQFEPLTLPQRLFRKIRYLTAKYVKSKSYHSIELDELQRHYKKQLRNVNLIVLVGGGLIKYKSQGIYNYLTALIDTAEELAIPLVINGAGVEDYSNQDPHCQLLKKSLNKEVVKSITTRDNLHTLTHHYLDPHSQKHIAKVADSAVYADEIYGIKKQTSDTIGIGLVRGGIFIDYEKRFSADAAAELYANIILELEKRGYNYQLFTNGYPGDNNLLPLIKTKLKRSHLSLIEPQQDEELVHTLAQFSAVIAARLHANIISYSLNIPSLGLVWNDKLKMFGHEIGYPERFFNYHDFNASHIVNTLEDARATGYEPTHRDQYRKTAKNNINYVLHHWQSGTL